jgi:hypothetical protein
MAQTAKAKTIDPVTDEPVPAKADPVAKVAVKEVKKVPPLHGTRFKNSEYERSTWVITPEVGTEPDDLLDTAYWAHVAIQMRPYDKVEVRADDGSYYGEMLVLLTGRTWAKVTPLFFKRLEEASADDVDDEEMFIKFSGPKAKWRVLRTKDGMVLSEGHSTKDLAATWMQNHKRQLAH